MSLFALTPADIDAFICCLAAAMPPARDLDASDKMPRFLLDAHAATLL